MAEAGSEDHPGRRAARLGAVALAVLLATATLAGTGLAYRKAGDGHAATKKGHIDLGFRDKAAAEECVAWDPPVTCTLRAGTSYQTWSIQAIMEEQFDGSAHFDLLGGMTRDPAVWMVCIYQTDPGPDPRCVDDHTDLPSSLLHADVDHDIRDGLGEDDRFLRVFLARAHNYDYRVDVTVH